MKRTAGIGTTGEVIAARHMIGKGYRILEKNFKNRNGRQLGEIDIIAQSGKTIVFVEVKTRVLVKGAAFTMLPPESAISSLKLTRMRRIGEHYLRLRGYLERPHRYDAIAVVLDEWGSTIEIRHIEDIFF